MKIFSLHIPKTAGTTLSFFYQHTFGKDVRFLYKCGKCNNYLFNKTLEEVWINKNCEHHTNLEDAKFNIINENVKIIHGHYRLIDLMDIKSDIDKVITWVRDPYSKVVSDYFFLQKERYLEDMSLLDNIENFIEIRKNSYQYYLDGINLYDIDFIGIVEDFNNDFQHMCKVLGISFESFPYKENVSVYDDKKLKFFESLKEYIISINEDDYKIYNESKFIKQTRGN